MNVCRNVRKIKSQTLKIFVRIAIKIASKDNVLFHKAINNALLAELTIF